MSHQRIPKRAANKNLLCFLIFAKKIQLQDEKREQMKMGCQKKKSFRVLKLIFSCTFRTCNHDSSFVHPSNSLKNGLINYINEKQNFLSSNFEWNQVSKFGTLQNRCNFMALRFTFEQHFHFCVNNNNKLLSNNLLFDQAAHDGPPFFGINTKST